MHGRWSTQRVASNAKPRARWYISFNHHRHQSSTMKYHESPSLIMISHHPHHTNPFCQSTAAKQLFSHLLLHGGFFNVSHHLLWKAWELATRRKPQRAVVRDQLDDGWPESVEEQDLLLLVWRCNFRNGIWKLCYRQSRRGVSRQNSEKCKRQ